MPKCAVFTLQRDEFFHLPLWLGYYGRNFAPEDIYILDHDSQLPDVRSILDRQPNVRVLKHEEIYDIDWYVETINGFRDELMERYEYVLYVDCDDWVIPNTGTLAEFIAKANKDAYRCVGYEVIEDVMHAWGPDDKPALARIRLQWGPGCHTSIPEIKATTDLFLYHLHRLDYAAAWAKRQLWQSYSRRGYLYQEVVDEPRYRHIFDTNGTTRPEPWHQRLRTALDEVRGS